MVSKQIPVEIGVHSIIKMRAQEAGMKLQSLASNILLAWARGAVYLCPGNGVDATPERPDDSARERAHD